MTSDPPPSPQDGNPGIHPRHRRTLESLQQESGEDSLWDLDDEPDADSGTADGVDGEDPVERPGRKPRIPDVKARWKTTPPAIEEPAAEPEPTPEPKPTPADPATPSPVRHETPTASEAPEQQAGESPSRSRAIDEIGDLEELGDWDEAEPSESQPPSTVADTSPESTRTPSGDTQASSPEADTSPVLNTATSEKTKDTRRKKNYGTVEKTAVAGVALILFAGIVFFMTNAFRGLPRPADPREMPELPASGEYVSVNQVVSYWRVPVTTGPDADTVQRGTELMPVVEITATAEQAAIRVQFRNSEGEAVGDPVTRTVSGETEFTFPSTAGLEDPAIHHAYRTGLIDPWTAEILEAPAGTTAGSAFRTVTTVPISPNRH